MCLDRVKQLQAQMTTQEEQLEEAANQTTALRAQLKQDRLATLVYKKCANVLATQLRAAEAAAKEAAAKEQVSASGASHTSFVPPSLTLPLS